MNDDGKTKKKGKKGRRRRTSTLRDGDVDTSMDACVCKTVKSGAVWVECEADNCEKFYHVDCVNVAGLTKEAVELLVGWRCPLCYVSPHTPDKILQTALGSAPAATPISEEVSEIISVAVTDALNRFSVKAGAVIESSTQVSVDLIKEESSTAWADAVKKGMGEVAEERTSDTVVKKVLGQIEQDRIERAKRKNNVVIRNVEEIKNKDGKLDKDEDFKFLTKTCGLQADQIVEHFRAGSSGTNSKGIVIPRPLVVKLTSPDISREEHLFNKGRRVEDHTDLDDNGRPRVYWVNADLCRADREAQFLVREERRKRLVKSEGSAKQKKQIEQAN